MASDGGGGQRKRNERGGRSNPHGPHAHIVSHKSRISRILAPTDRNRILFSRQVDVISAHAEQWGQIKCHDPTIYSAAVQYHAFTNTESVTLSTLNFFALALQSSSKYQVASQQRSFVDIPYISQRQLTLRNSSSKPSSASLTHPSIRALIRVGRWGESRRNDIEPAA